jgi:hypothetical protein
VRDKKKERQGYRRRGNEKEGGRETRKNTGI